MKRIAGLLIVFFVLSVGGREAVPQEEGVLRIGPGKLSATEFFGKLESAGIRVVYNAHMPQIRGLEIQLNSVQELKHGEVLDWARTMLSYYRLMLVPAGRAEERLYHCVDVHSTAATARPIYVPESELDDWKHRDGAYITTTIFVKKIRDMSPLRSALAQLSTRQIGRVNEVPGSRAFVIGEFAPVAWNMLQLVRAADIEDSGIIRPGGVIGDLERYEELLATCHTETAAAYFRERIVELRKE